MKFLEQAILKGRQNQAKEDFGKPIELNFESFTVKLMKVRVINIITLLGLFILDMYNS